MGGFATMLSLIALLAAAPPLTEAQRAQLADTADRTRTIDEGALYALLPNVLAWAADDEIAARLNVDYQALLNDPEASAARRGEVVLVSGAFYGRSHRFTLQRAGLWGEAVTMWVLALDDQLQRMAVVLLVDPEGDWHENPPRRGQRVEVPARFYKIWRQRDNNQRLTDYLVFVGRHPELPRGSTGSSTGDVGLVGFGGPLLLAIGVAAALVVLLRRRAGRLSLQPRPLSRQAALHEREPVTPNEQAEADEGEPLPDDPAAALDELSRRGGAQDRTPPGDHGR